MSVGVTVPPSYTAHKINAPCFNAMDVHVFVQPYTVLPPRAANVNPAHVGLTPC